MQYWVYILYSTKLKRYYTGFSKDPDRRLEQHRTAENGWTCRAGDWREIFRTSVSDKSSARVLEASIKSRGAKRFLQENMMDMPRF